MEDTYSPTTDRMRSGLSHPLTSSVSRRRFLAATGAGLLTLRFPSTLTGAPEDHPLASFDREMEAFMKARGVPGGALAIVKDRKLIYARGYGWADREKKLPVKPTSLFRIASVSKPFTAVAVMKLVEQGKLSFDDRAFNIVRLSPAIANGAKPDPRLSAITIGQLLHHTGGWDRDQSFDPMFRSDEIAKAVGVPRPAGAEAIIRFMLGKPLQFDPGSRYAYSNFGYCVLGRVIERVSKMSYEEFVKREVLAPAGIKTMRVGGTLEKETTPGEVHYYTANDATGASVFADVPGKVPAPYGTWFLRAMDAHGGWIASAVDLMRFAAALDDPRHSSLLKPESFAAMYAPPPAPVWRKDDGTLQDVYYGCGWLVRRLGGEGKFNYWHNGSLPGTNSLLVRLANGLSWAALFNLRSEDNNLPDGEIDGALHRAAAVVKDWPKQDLFAQFAG